MILLTSTTVKVVDVNNIICFRKEVQDAMYSRCTYPAVIYMKKVMIIEDTMSKYQDIENACHNLGMTVIKHANNRNDALRYLYRTEQLPDLIILDMMFPIVAGGHIDMKCGEDVLEHLRIKQINVPVIMCSADTCDVDTYENVIGSILYNPMCLLNDDLEKCIQNIDKSTILC